MGSNSIYAIMACFLFCVSTYTVITKFQDEKRGKDGRVFSHPYWQTFLCAVGESFALWVYLIRRKKSSSV